MCEMTGILKFLYCSFLMDLLISKYRHYKQNIFHTRLLNRYEGCVETSMEMTRMTSRLQQEVPVRCLLGYLVTHGDFKTTVQTAFSLRCVENSSFITDSPIVFVSLNFYLSIIYIANCTRLRSKKKILYMPVHHLLNTSIYSYWSGWCTEYLVCEEKMKLRYIIFTFYFKAILKGYLFLHLIFIFHLHLLFTYIIHY